MFYVSSKVNSLYGITDTEDGVEEFYTLEDCRKLSISSNFNIIGLGLTSANIVNCYSLMNKDKIVMNFILGANCEVLTTLPLGFTNIEDWINNRKKFSCAINVERFFRSIGINNNEDYIEILHGVALSDTFWLKNFKSKLSWIHVSPFRNNYSKFISNYALDGCLTKDDKSYLSPDISTDGSFPHTWKFYDVNNISFIKASSKYTLGGVNSGNEPISEYLVSQLLGYLGANYVEYDLLSHKRSDGRYDLVTSCKCFTSEKIGSVSASRLNLLSYEKVIEFCKNYLSKEDLNNIIIMFLVDCLTINTDRHFGNIEFLVNNDTQKIIKLAPIFDNNNALLPRFVIGFDNFDLNDYRTRCDTTFDSLFELIMSYRNLKPLLIKLKNFKFVNFSIVAIDNKRLDFCNQLLKLMITYYLNKFYS